MQQRLRASLHKSGGAPAYFLGKAGEDGRIAKIKMLCRETHRAPMLLFSVPRSGEFILHNDADPQLLPSKSDEEYSQRFDEKGVGYMLIDNAVQHAHVLVDGQPAEAPLQLLDEDQIVGVLGPHGPLASKLPRYEKRVEQMEMVRAVTRALNYDQVLMVEAGTGTGKSLAYLIPSIYWAHQNRERILVSTKTINLQEQIFYKDIPFLKKVLDIPFQAILAKGRNNYLCIRRMHQQLQAHQPPDAPPAPKELQRLFYWSKQTTSGDRSELSFLPSESTWQQVRADGDACGRTKCEFYKTCFYYMARRRQADADILVANHHVLFADLALRE
ncbi:MAG: DEAD/DEAH box helicase, partial [Myxococcota bacterium]